VRTGHVSGLCLCEQSERDTRVSDRDTARTNSFANPANSFANPADRFAYATDSNAAGEHGHASSSINHPEWNYPLRAFAREHGEYFAVGQSFYQHYKCERDRLYHGLKFDYRFCTISHRQHYRLCHHIQQQDHNQHSERFYYGG